MLALGKALWWLLQPSTLLLLTLLLGTLAVGRRRRLGRVLLAAALVGMVLPSLLPLSAFRLLGRTARLLP